MNISNVKINYNQYKNQDLIEIIFEKQKVLMDYYKIPEIDLDIPKDQQLLRSFAWSIVEECGEAFDVTMRLKLDKEHLLDEIADMTHFYIELLIMSNITVSNFFNSLGVLDFNELKNEKHFFTFRPETFLEFVIQLSLSINVLKNRMWRESNLLTDKEKYFCELTKTISLFFKLILSFNISLEEWVDAYLRKNEINLFRIKSKY